MIWVSFITSMSQIEASKNTWLIKLNQTESQSEDLGQTSIDQNEKPRVDPFDKAESSSSIIFKYANKIKPLSSKEQLEGIKEAQAGVKSSHDQIALSNMRLVIRIASRFRGRGIEYEDLIQEGMVGLLHAIKKYSVLKGTKFSTYATYWIQQSIQRAIETKSLSIRLPINVHKEKSKLSGALKRLTVELGRQPTSEELAAATNISVHRVEAAEEATKVVCSLDTPYGDTELTIGDMFESNRYVSPENLTDYKLDSAQINEALSKLSFDERSVIELYYGLGSGKELKSREITKELGCDKSAVARIRRRALRKLRKKDSLKQIFESL